MKRARKDRAFIEYLIGALPRDLRTIRAIAIDAIVDRHGSPVLARVAMEHGKAFDVWLVGDEAGLLGNSGMRTDSPDPYVRQKPSLFPDKNIGIDSDKDLTGLAIIRTIRETGIFFAPVGNTVSDPEEEQIDWQADLVVKQQSLNWCIPFSMALLSPFLPGGAQTEKDLADSWGQVEGVGLIPGTPGFDKFVEQCLDTHHMVDTTPAGNADADWFYTLGKPTLLIVSNPAGHATVCAGVARNALRREDGTYVPAFRDLNSDGKSDQWMDIPDTGYELKMALTVP